MAELNSEAEVRAAIEQEKASTTPNQQRRHYLIQKAVEHGCVDAIPDDWGMEVKADG